MGKVLLETGDMELKQGMEAESSSSSPLCAIFQDVKAFATLHFLNFKSLVLPKNM